MQQQSEELTPWLFSILAPYSTIFETLYSIQFQLADTIIFKQGEPKIWYTQNQKNIIKTRDDEWLKWRIIGFFLKYQNITDKQINELIQQDSSDFVENPQSQGLSFYYEQRLAQGKIYRGVTYSVAQELFKNPNEKNDLLNNWTKIIDCRKINRPKHLFSMSFQRDQLQSNGKCYFLRKRLANTNLEVQEFSKQDNNVSKKVVQLKEEFDKSVAAQQNQQCELFIRSVCKFLEGKLKKQISRLDLEFFLTDGDFQIYLCGLDAISCFTVENNQEALDVNTVQIEDQKIENFDKCKGIYCQFSSNKVFFDENDEQFSLFVLFLIYYQIMADDKQKQKKLTFKSIFLDLIERYKTIESIKQNSSNKIIGNIPEILIFKLRKYYSLGDITNSPLFKHLKIANFYKEQIVCFYCYHVYNKLDQMRNKHFSNHSQKNLSAQEIKADVDKFYSQSTFNRNSIDLGDQSQYLRFNLKLKQFDKDQLNFFQEFTLTYEKDDKYFQRRNKKKDIYSSIKGFQLPNITKIEIQDKNNMIRKVKYVVPKEQVESLGLKHYLGHASNLPYSDQGLAISKSSLELNKLQDKIREIQRIKERMEQDKITKTRKDIEMMMCTYYGNGQTEKERLIDFVETVRKRARDEIEEEEQESELKIQIVTDKNDFLSENQRRIKQDQEKQEQEILQTKKDFLELNSDLANSIQQRTSIQKIDYMSSELNSDY